MTEAEKANQPDLQHLPAEMVDKYSVKFTYLNTGEKVKFYVHQNDKLSKAWDEAYKELLEARKEGDELQCADGHSMMGYLHQTMKHLQDHNICTDRKFEIRSKTGGA